MGGVESYLNAVLSALAARGNQIAMICETAEPPERPLIELPQETPVWSGDPLSIEAILDKLRAWGADVIFSHGLRSVSLERAIVGLAPSVLYAHNYYGCCISGVKSFSRPQSRPCDRRFGASCLLQFYPRRCGGLNPVTMARLYRRESDHLKLLSNYATIVTASEHMRREYLRQGLEQGFVRMIPPPIAENEPAEKRRSCARSKEDLTAERDWKLLFLGRMTPLKGGEVLLDALPELASRLSRPLRLIFAGDGPARARWERRAVQVGSRLSGGAIEFRGWLSGSAYWNTLAEADLLVMPSLWPEPFGRAGLEAGRYGVPSAAFAAGGIPEWLIDGINGHLALGNPASASGLAEAIWRCIGNREHHAQLCAGARRQAARFSIEQHIDGLCALFDEVVAR